MVFELLIDLTFLLIDLVMNTFVIKDFAFDTTNITTNSIFIAITATETTADGNTVLLIVLKHSKIYRRVMLLNISIIDINNILRLKFHIDRMINLQ